MSRRDAYRLIYTEGTYVMAEASMKPLEEDFDQYRLSTMQDDRVCEICEGVSQQVFEIEDREPGANFPPLHPWCRCTFTIEVADWDAWMDRYVEKHGGDPAISDQQRDELWRILERVDGRAALIEDAAFQKYRIDYGVAHSFAEGDARLMNMLRSGDAQKVSDAVEEILNGEAYDLPTSYWPGRTTTGRTQDMFGVLGRKEYWCDITIREDQCFIIKVFIHENLHASSLSRYTKT